MNTVKGLASEGLDVQLGLIQRFKHYHGEGRDEIFNFVCNMVDLDTIPVPDDTYVDADARQIMGDRYDGAPSANTAEKFAAIQAMSWWTELNANLPYAPTYVMTEDMMALTEHAGASVNNVGFTEESMPTDRGFLFLPRPLVTLDKHGERLSARAVLWWKSAVRLHGTGKRLDEGMTVRVPSMHLMLFSSKADWMQDDYMQELHDNDPASWATVPLYTLVHLMPCFLQNSPISGMVDSDGPVSVDMGDSIDITSDEDRTQLSWLAFLKTFMLLVKQKVAVTHTERERHSHRRWVRAGLPPDDGEIQVITLRKRRPTSEHEITDGTSMEWSHRWMVSGHWRDQYYPSCPLCRDWGEACKTHEQLWINTYEKGPEDKPLVITDKVFVWKR